MLVNWSLLPDRLTTWDRYVLSAFPKFWVSFSELWNQTRPGRTHPETKLSLTNTHKHICVCIHTLTCGPPYAHTHTHTHSFSSLIPSIAGYCIILTILTQKWFSVFGVFKFGIIFDQRTNAVEWKSRYPECSLPGLRRGSAALWSTGRDYAARAIMLRIVKFGRLTVMDADQVLKPQALQTHMWGSSPLPLVFRLTAGRCEIIRGEKLRDKSRARCHFPFPAAASSRIHLLGLSDSSRLGVSAW